MEGSPKPERRPKMAQHADNRELAPITRFRSSCNLPRDRSFEVAMAVLFGVTVALGLSLGTLVYLILTI